MKGKSLIFEILRWVCVLRAVVLLIHQFGGNTVSSADAATVTAAVTETVDMSNMQIGDSRMIKRLYSLNPSDFEDCILYYPNTNMMAEEILIVKLRDTKQQETVCNAIQARLDTQKNTFEGYGVEQFDLLSNYSAVECRGNFILFVVSKDFSAARSAFLDAL